MQYILYTGGSRRYRRQQRPIGGGKIMNIEQAKKQAELVYEASQHLGEEEAQRLYDETLANLLADAEDADNSADAADAADTASVR